MHHEYAPSTLSCSLCEGSPCSPEMLLSSARSYSPTVSGMLFGVFNRKNSIAGSSLLSLRVYAYSYLARREHRQASLMKREGVLCNRNQNSSTPPSHPLLLNLCRVSKVKFSHLSIGSSRISLPAKCHLPCFALNNNTGYMHNML